MDEITKCLNHLCDFIRNKRAIVKNGQSRVISYDELTKQSFGAFKGNKLHKDKYVFISDFMKNSESFLNKSVELDNIVYVLVDLFIKANLNEISDGTYMLLNDLIDGVTIGGVSLDALNNNECKVNLAKIKEQLLNKFNSELDLDESLNDAFEQNGIIPETPLPPSNNINNENRLNLGQNNNANHQIPVNQNQSLISGNAANVININDLYEQLRIIARDEFNKSNKTVSNQNMPKLTVQSLKDLRQLIYNKYEKLLKVENIISLFKTHKENNTVPDAICFKRFPKPLWIDDPTFVDNHNNIIKLAQNQIVESIIDHGIVIIDCLNTELCELKSNLDNSYNGNKEKFFDNIKATVQSDLKKFFDASNAKLLRLQNNYFEDHITTEYEFMDNITDEYINSYLQFNANNNIDDISKQKQNISVNKPSNKRVYKNYNSSNNKSNNSKKLEMIDDNKNNNNNVLNKNNKSYYKNNYNKTSNYNNNKQNHYNPMNENWRKNMTKTDQAIQLNKNDYYNQQTSHNENDRNTVTNHYNNKNKNNNQYFQNGQNHDTNS